MNKRVYGQIKIIKRSSCLCTVGSKPFLLMGFHKLSTSSADGWLKVVKRVHFGISNIRFNAIVVSDWFHHASLRILRFGTLESPHKLMITSIYFPVNLAVIRGVEGVFEENILIFNAWSGVQHSADQHWIMLIYLSLLFWIRRKLPNLSCLALGLESKNEYFLGADVLSWDFIPRRLFRCFSWHCFFHLRSSTLLELTLFHIFR